VGGADDPRLWVSGRAEAPRLHRADQCVVHDVLGQRQVRRAERTRERADQVRVLTPEQVLDQRRRVRLVHGA
jgi:hypothetical protein